MEMMQDAGICHYNVIDGGLVNKPGYPTIYTNPKMPKARIKIRAREKKTSAWKKILNVMNYKILQLKQTLK